MKKRILIILSLVIVLFIIAGGVVFVAYDKGPEVLRARIVKQLRDDYQIVTEIKSLGFRVFPVPHVAAEGVSLKHDAALVSIEAIDFYPNVSRMLRGKITLSSVRVKRPEIRIKSLEKIREILNKPKKDKPFCDSLNLPPFKLTIVKGLADITLDGPLSVLNGKVPNAVFSDISLSVLSDTDNLHVKGTILSPYTHVFSSEIDLQMDNGVCTWDVALEAETIDLSAARQILAGLYPKNPTVKVLFGNLIRSGHLSKTSYSFKGQHDEWGDIRRMTADSQVDHVSIRVPGSSLVLSDIQGPLQMSEGVLSGENLTALMNGSSAKNGRFELELNKAPGNGMGKNNRHFDLDIDIDADLAGLPKVLDNFIREGTFRKEYQNFRGIQGRADVHLTLKDNLRNLKTYVQAQNINAGGYYPRLGRALAIKEGSMQFNPDRISWNGIKGRIGPHEIKECSGAFSFDKNRSFDLTSLTARIDSKDAHRYASTFKDLRKTMGKHLAGIGGTVDIKSLVVKGPLARPHELTYTLSAASDKLKLNSPDLPSEASASFDLFEFTPGRFRLPACTVNMNGRVFTLNGSMERLEKDMPSGMITIRGKVDKDFRPYIKRKKWIPEALFPKLPVTLNPLTVSWNGRNVTLSGMFLRDDPALGTIQTAADIDLNPNGSHIRKLTVETVREQAEVTATIPEAHSLNPIKGRFSGNLKGKTLTALFEKSDLIRGDMEGFASFEYPLSGQDAFKLNGPLTISDAVFKKENGETITVDNARFNGKGDQASIRLEGFSRVLAGTENGNGPSSLEFPHIIGNVSFLRGKKALVNVASGNVCGISFSGNVTLPDLDMDLSFASDRQRVMGFYELLSCFGVSSTAMTGDLDVEGLFKGNPAMISKGAFKIRATRGLVKKAPILAKVLSLVDLTELFSQNPIKNVMSSGYRYDSMEIDGTITGHNIHITRAAIIGAGINFYATGYIDLESRILDLVVLASPFKAVDSVFYHIPLAGPFLSGKNKSLLSVPIVVEGDINNPRTRFLPKPVSTVSSGVMDLFVNTFKLPFVLTYDLVTSGKSDKKEK